MSSLSHIINSFANLHVLVIGDVMLDSYLEGNSERICREAPVPVVDVLRRTDAPGGAANTAANLRSLGASVSLLAVSGDDGEATLLRRALGERGIDDAHLLALPGRATLAKHRIIASGHMLLRYDQGDTEAVDGASERALITRLRDLVPTCDAIVVSDYGYGVLTPRVIEVLGEVQARSPRVLLADAKNLRAYRNAGLTAVKPNYNEAVRLLGPHLLRGVESRVEAIASHGERLLESIGTRIAAVTLDTDGALVFERGSLPYRTYAQPTAHARAAGAGDTFVSGLALALAAGATTPAAAEIASAAAAIVVSHNGTVTCSAADLHEHLSGGNKVAASLERLAERLERARANGQRIVFTNGCFDLLHQGHIALLNRAKTLGDLLVVGVNSDESVRRLKGLGRPLCSLAERMEVLAALSCIDHLIAFDDDLPHGLIQAIRPDVVVKGGDYSRASMPEAALVEHLGGRIEFLPYLEDHPLIERAVGE
ncbi:MAG: PfkB family carbohydrate kinase [Chloroflexaceae bacterium]|jgi:D-beta-D-heptose 7-phosphate kinase/D-beta-D-heptose 1-phosphate adenosyltransferase|nr:PfkB family carbohydrate kinase [Chloroflexaceae bacterium]